MAKLAHILALGTVAGLGAAPAQAFTFENGTIWPLAVSINGSAAQVVAAEEVAFLFRGQCPAGCTLSIAVADPAQAQTPIRGAGGEPPAIAGNGDAATVRARLEGGGVSVEIVGGGLPAQTPVRAARDPRCRKRRTGPRRR
ncbi:MAG: hypothetical protein R3F55_24725 [Alphaproteobacteria bacterium]